MKILAFPEEPSGTDPAHNHPSVPTLPPMRCASWCVRADGHPHAVHSAEQLCSSVEQRIDTVHGGGTGDGVASTSSATLVARAQQLPCQAPTYLIGIQTMDSEMFAETTPAELAMFIEQLRLLLKTTGQVELLRG